MKSLAFKCYSAVLFGFETSELASISSTQDGTRTDTLLRAAHTRRNWTRHTHTSLPPVHRSAGNSGPDPAKGSAPRPTRSGPSSLQGCDRGSLPAERHPRLVLASAPVAFAPAVPALASFDDTSAALGGPRRGRAACADRARQPPLSPTGSGQRPRPGPTQLPLARLGPAGPDPQRRRTQRST